ncbi:MAG: ral secretion pathway protein [Hyphomicrobiales bacterium]
MRKQNADGFILVAVLWIIAALATLATIFSVYVINTATAFTVHDERLQAEGCARAAIELAVYQLIANLPGAQQGAQQSAQQSMPTRGRFVFRVGNAQVTTDFNSETARIDLNAAPKELLAGLFAALGAAPNDAQAYADRIIAWRSPPSANIADNEASNYRAAGVIYAPRGSQFPHTGELGLVLGIPDLMVERALPFLTVYSGRPQINILDAAPQVIAALPGMAPARLQAVLAARNAAPQDAQALVESLGAAQALATTQGGKSVRVTARIAFDSGQRMTTEVVIFLTDNGTEPYRILTWRDDIDDAQTDARATR